MAPESQHRPRSFRSQHLPSTALAALLAALVILPLLGHNRLTDWDEGIYAQVSRQMLQSGWLVPHWNLQPWLEKPPFTFWITALFDKLFGISEFTARLGSALAGIALVALLHHWLLRTTERATATLTAWLSTVILLSTFGFLHIARVGETDTLLSFGCLLALIGLTEVLRNAHDAFNPAAEPVDHPAAEPVDHLASYRYPEASEAIQISGRPNSPEDLKASWYPEASASGFMHAEKIGALAPNGMPSLNGWYLYWTGLAIALMSKGAASAGLFLTLLLLLVLDPTLRRRLHAPFFHGLVLFLLLILPWHLYLLHRFGHLFVDEYLNLHILGRVTHQYDGHITHWWYYFRVLLFSAPPWVLLYPIAIYTALRQPRLRPLALFAIIQLIAFSFVQTRLPHYMAPIYAPLSALVAIWIAAQAQAYLQTHPSLRPRIFYLQFAAALAALWILTALLTAHPRSQLHSPRLPNGVVTPNNREVTALLKQVFQHPSPLVANTPGPLLDARPGTYNPIPTVLFYASRPVQQVQFQPPGPASTTPANATMDIYTYNPIPLSQAVTTEPRLILLARSPPPQIPTSYTFQSLASSPTLEVGLISRHP